MARFLKHTSCPQCGSSDARGVYDDGSSWCFSCQSFTPSSIGAKLVGATASGEAEGTVARRPPDDLSSVFGRDAMDWLSKTGISVETLLEHHVRFSPSKNQIVFTWPNTDVWQARNCWKEAKSRYFTSGNHDSRLPIYYCGGNVNRMVLTEDSLSSIKCVNATNVDAMPLLGNHLHSSKMRALKRLYKRVDVFLDEDKYKEAVKISSRLRLLGLESRTYLDTRDPKHIPYDELKEILNAI